MVWQPPPRLKSLDPAFWGSSQRLGIRPTEECYAWAPRMPGRLTQFRPIPGKTRHASRYLCPQIIGQQAPDFDRALGLWIEGATQMLRILMTSFILAASIVTLTPHADAQSPDPALLAPAAGQAGLASPRNTVLRPSYTSPRFGGTSANMKSRSGRYLSHPRVHGL
jgi:hypothetical protein